MRRKPPARTLDYFDSSHNKRTANWNYNSPAIKQHDIQHKVNFSVILPLDMNRYNPRSQDGTPKIPVNF